MSVTLKQIQSYCDEWAPPELAASWDSVGIQIGHPEDTVQSVLVALEVTLPVLQHLRDHPVDLVVTHHPLFFKPLKSLDTRSDTGQILTTFLGQSMGLFTMHTNLDATVGGVNDALVEQYGLDPLAGARIQNGLGLSYVFSRPRSIESLASVLPGRIVGAARQETVSRVAFCGGAGRSLLPKLVEMGVDLFITGELSYHDEVYCEYHGITALLVGHHESEAVVLPSIAARLSQQFSDLSVTVFGA